MNWIVPPGIYGEEARKILTERHPELQGMTLGERRIVEPPIPLVKGESRFKRLENDYRYDAIYKWPNRPDRSRPIGAGHGFSAITETPHFIRTNNLKKVPDCANSSSYLRMSAKCVDLLKHFDPGAIEILSISHSTSRNVRIDGEYYLVDVMRILPSIEWGNSQIVAEGVRYPLPPHTLKISMGVPLGFRVRKDIAPDVHVFRDELFKSYVFVSPELRDAMQQAGVTGTLFSDPAGALALNEAPTF